MTWAISRSCYRQLLRETARPNSVPPFLLPAFSAPNHRHQFSSSAPAQSRVGSAPLSIPPEVTLKLIDLPASKFGAKSDTAPVHAIEVTGPLGVRTLNIPPFSTFNYDSEGRKATFEVQDSSIKEQRAMWGTVRQHLKNYVIGVSEGHIRILKLVGVGFRASVEPTAITVKTQEYAGQQFVNLKVGYAHPIELPIPEGVKVSTPQPTTILLEGINEQVVSQFAANIRQWRPPEPYKGKGIFVNGETIKLKAKKIK